METVIATKVVEFAFNSIAGKLEKMLEEEVALLAGVEDEVRDIVAELKTINSFLTDMSTRRNLDDRQQNWVQEVREVAYDAEDLIDEFECRLRSIPYEERGVKGLFMRFCRCLKSLKIRHGVASELQKLKVEVEEIRKRHDRYSHPNESLTSLATVTCLDMADRYSDPRIIGHFVEEAELVGIVESREKIIEWTFKWTEDTYDECRKLTVISLVGFGGLGKTTLAKTVYDDPRIRGFFRYRIWIVVSQQYNIKELLKQIIRNVSKDSGWTTDLDNMDESQLVQTARDHLHGYPYFLVFDDVWRNDTWKSLSIALPDDYNGSRVIVTTRSEEVANISCSRDRRFIFKVSPLSPEQSWELFCRKVFEAPDYNCPPDLENVGREIVQKCNGLPLAIVTVGGLLASKSNKNHEEWKNSRDHLRLEIEHILGLSYNDLSYDLKPCFLFLGTYPKNYEIPRKHLMRRWIAEGIVSGVGGLLAEEEAERLFYELVSRNLVQPSQFDDSGTVKSCRVHEEMLNVIISISRKENFAVQLKEHPTNPPQHQKIRRLSWHDGNSGLVPNTDLSHLRSFTAFGDDIPLKDYRKQRLLRAIVLEGCRNSLHLHPKSFSKLFLLKYLSLRDSRISALPDSIGALQNLEFLDIRGTDIEELPNSIIKLQKLTHLLSGSLKVYNLLTSEGFKRLKVPKGIRKLKKLRTLGMACADNVRLLREIGELVELKKLAICFGIDDLSSRMMEEINALLFKLNRSLQSLTILHFAEGSIKEALDEVASPPLLLCKLQINALLAGLPAWFASLEKVVEITLSNTQLQLQDLQVLRNLHTLVKLFLGSGSFDDNGEDLVFDHVGFTHLKFLTIQSQSVNFEKGSVQRLEILKMISFTGYSVNGIEYLHGLKEVHIHTENGDIMKMVKNIAANHSNHPKCFAITTDPLAKGI
ncbi:disease resistance protein PIK6-NP-like [Zingiber officinale]|nr:disease resistance protein PIK6-NP-like [Zingiber officinale]